MLSQKLIPTVFCILTLSMFQSLADAQTVTLAADDWCPVNCNPESARPGYMVEITKSILKPLGYEVRYINLNWSRSLIYARSGRIDGVFGAMRGDAPDFVFPKVPQGESEFGLFVKSTSPWVFTSNDSLAGKNVGLIRDYAYGDKLEQLVKKYARPQYSGGDRPLELLMQQLLADRIDMLIEDVNVFRHEAATLGLTSEFRLAKSFSAQQLFVALSPELETAPALARHLTDGMTRLRQSGELDTIMAKYGLTAWPETGAVTAPMTE